MMQFVKSAIRDMTPLRMKKTLARMALSNGLEIAISDLVARGFAPGGVIDVGAYVGEWTKAVSRLLPRVPVLMIEAQAEKATRLKSVAWDIGDHVAVEIALLLDHAGEKVAFFEMETGSSIYPENTAVPRKRVVLETQTLDDVVARTAGVRPPYFLKLDVQGAELDVLRGGMETLRHSAAVVLEAAVTDYNIGAPDFNDVTSFMRSAGFVIHDVVNLLRHDGALVQMDVLFCRQ